jgi:pSer/pThr/pTyr-binding forkhead associated (FHA) protein
MMSQAHNGELVPLAGGDTIPLIRSTLSVGRRESCDICLRSPNVSAIHGELIFEDGCWIVHDLGSTNGTKVNGVRVQRKTLFPGDTVSFAKHSYTIEYVPASEQRLQEVLEEEEEDVLSLPLLERAGLVHGGGDGRNRQPRR